MFTTRAPESAPIPEIYHYPLHAPCIVLFKEQAIKNRLRMVGYSESVRQLAIQLGTLVSTEHHMQGIKDVSRQHQVNFIELWHILERICFDKTDLVDKLENLYDGFFLESCLQCYFDLTSLLIQQYNLNSLLDLFNYDKCLISAGNINILQVYFEFQLLRQKNKAMFDKAPLYDDPLYDNSRSLTDTDQSFPYLVDLYFYLIALNLKLKLELETKAKLENKVWIASIESILLKLRFLFHNLHINNHTILFSDIKTRLHQQQKLIKCSNPKINQFSIINKDAVVEGMFGYLCLGCFKPKLKTNFTIDPAKAGHYQKVYTCGVLPCGHSLCESCTISTVYCPYCELQPKRDPLPRNKPRLVKLTTSSTKKLTQCSSCEKSLLNVFSHEGPVLDNFCYLCQCGEACCWSCMLKSKPCGSCQQPLTGAEQKIHLEQACLSMVQSPLPEYFTDKQCSICMDAVADTVILSCGHLCCCFSCAKELYHRHDACPICRKEIILIQQTVPVLQQQQASAATVKPQVAKKCVRCAINSINVVNVPCGHANLCWQCAFDLHGSVKVKASRCCHSCGFTVPIVQRIYSV